ncbi:MAG: heptosyltransferase [Candidimonas sp.]|nr:MAG: heptosyltransferase [Candidimonas sp.]
MPTISAIYLRLPNWIGDVCMSLPTLHTLRNTAIPVTVCARPWARDLLAGFEGLDFVDMKGRWRVDRDAVGNHRKQARHLHARGLLLPNSLSSAMVFKFAGIPSAGYRDGARGLILRWPIDKPAVPMHAVRRWHNVATQALQRWNLPAHPATPDLGPGLKPTRAQRDDAAAALAAAGLTAHDFILIAPTATGLHHGRIKVWPHFDTLTRALQTQGYRVAMCPPPGEVADARQNAPAALCLPPLGLGAFAALTRLASLVVCNDSGVSHLAAASGAKQLTLFGVTHKERTGPWSNSATCLGSAHAWPSPTEVERMVDSLLQC